jgi:hypothetical protein
MEREQFIKRERKAENKRFRTSNKGEQRGQRILRNPFIHGTLTVRFKEVKTPDHSIIRHVVVGYNPVLTTDRIGPILIKR